MSGGQGGGGAEPADSAGKRKAGSPAEGSDARQKRSAPGSPDPAALDERRREVAEVYAAYDTLYRTSLAAQQQQPQHDADGSGADSPSSASAAPSEDEAAAFLRLVQAGASGFEGVRRLAARLVPRYARRFPQHSSPAAEALIALSTLSLEDEPEQQAAVRADAASGLTEVAAAARAAGTGGQQATIKLVDFCFKQLRHVLTAATAPTAAAGATNGDLPNGGGSGSVLSSRAGASSGGVCPAPHLWGCLELCFASHFRCGLFGSSLWYRLA